MNFSPSRRTSPWGPKARNELLVVLVCGLSKSTSRWTSELWPHEHMKVHTLYQLTKFGSNWTFSNEVNFTFWANLTPKPLMTFDLGIWPLTTWTYEGSHNYCINKPSLALIWLQLLKWGHSHIFSLSYNLTSNDLWPWYMTFYLINIWRVPYCINKPSLVPIGIQLFKWGHLHFQQILQLDHRWPLTLICDL